MHRTTVFFRLFFLVLLGLFGADKPVRAQENDGNSWAEVQAEKKGILHYHYHEIPPYVFRDSDGKVNGIEVEILEAFSRWLRQTKDIELELIARDRHDFSGAFSVARQNTKGTLVLAGLSVTESRSREIKFSPTYLPDIEVVISGSSAEASKTIFDFAEMVNNGKAYTVLNTTYEENLLELKNVYFPDMEYEYVQSADQLLEAIAGRSNAWGYISLPTYLVALKEGKEVKRHKFFKRENRGLAIGMSQECDWDLALDEYFASRDFREDSEKILQKYLGNRLTELIRGITSDSTEQKTDSEEVDLLTAESEIRNHRLRKTESVLENIKDVVVRQKQMTYVMGAGIILLLSGMVFYYRLNRLKKKANQELSAKNTEIARQSENLRMAYESQEVLTRIGRDITSKLAVDEIIDTIYENVNKLMDATAFGIGIYNMETDCIDFLGVHEEGEKLDFFSYSASDETLLGAVCFKQQIDVFINNYDIDYPKYVTQKRKAVAGRETASVMYVPLKIYGKSIGVITVQSYSQNAYTGYHLNLLKSIAIYTKIALDNAAAYDQIAEKTRSLSEANEDIKAQKLLIEEKNEALTELNEEKNKLIEIVAHDLRNPLTSAISIAELMRTEAREGGEPEDMEEYANGVLTSLNRINAMISKILDIKAVEAKRVNIKAEDFDVREVIDQLCKQMQRQAEKKNIRLLTDFPEQPVQLFADRTFLTQIYENLLSNAVKFSPPGKEVTVRLSSPPGRVVTEVRDQGPGLTEADKANLFKRYQRLSARPTGGEKSTGLGLSIVKKFTESLGGEVWCESEAGKGASFFVAFERE